jgi:hypothetical protein
MAGSSGADGLVCWILDHPARVTDPYIRHTIGQAESRLNAPEAPRPKHNRIHFNPLFRISTATRKASKHNRQNDYPQSPQETLILYHRNTHNALL